MPDVALPEHGGLTRFFGATALLYSADVLLSVVLAWGVFALTHSALWLAVAVSLPQIPKMFAGAFGPQSYTGARSMAEVAAFAAGIAGVFALLLAGARGPMAAFWLMAGGFAVAFADASLVPLGQASLMQRLPRAGRVLGSRNYELWSRLPRLVAPLVAGTVLGFGLAPALALTALFMLLCGALLRGWPLPQVHHAHESSALRLSLGIVRRDNWLKAALGVRGLGNLLWPAYTLALPILVRLRLHGNALSFGVLAALYGLSTLIATGLAGRLPLGHLRLLYYVSWAISGCGLLITALSPTLVLAAAGTLLLGLGSPVIHMALDSHIGSEVPEQAQGAVFSFQRLLMAALALLGTYGMGILVAALGAGLTLAFAGATTVACAACGGILVITGSRSTAAQDATRDPFQPECGGARS